MKKEKNVLELIIREFSVYAVEIVLALGAILGVLYSVSFIAEFFSGLVDIGAGLLVVFLIAGLALYIDFKPDEKKQPGKHCNSASRTSALSSSSGMIRVYSEK